MVGQRRAVFLSLEEGGRQILLCLLCLISSINLFKQKEPEFGLNFVDKKKIPENQLKTWN